MNIEEIKAGETYNVRVKIYGNYGSIIKAHTVAETGVTILENDFCSSEAAAFSPIPTPPKHDPCRPFRNGDIVRYVERDGRSYVDAPPVGATCCVCVGEDSVGMVSVEFKFSENEEPAVHDVPFYHLELVTPVEELEPYSVHSIVGDNGKTAFFAVRKGDVSVAAFFCDIPRALTEEQARAAAEAERNRLNAEYRKERENG